MLVPLCIVLWMTDRQYPERRKCKDVSGMAACRTTVPKDASVEQAWTKAQCLKNEWMELHIAALQMSVKQGYLLK